VGIACAGSSPAFGTIYIDQLPADEVNAPPWERGLRAIARGAGSHSTNTVYPWPGPAGSHSTSTVFPWERGFRAIAR
jgi:hypothetical protein